jgi:hypothetical protein
MKQLQKTYSLVPCGITPKARKSILHLQITIFASTQGRGLLSHNAYSTVHKYKICKSKGSVLQLLQLLSAWPYSSRRILPIRPTILYTLRLEVKSKDFLKTCPRPRVRPSLSLMWLLYHNTPKTKPLCLFFCP